MLDTVVTDTIGTIPEQPSKKLRLTSIKSGETCLVLEIDHCIEGSPFTDCERRGRRFGRRRHRLRPHRRSGQHHHDIRCRLMDLGITPGTKVKVIQAQRVGPILLEVRDSRLALGKGMARRVIVSRI